MSQTLALIPAKRHSEGVPDKNWRPLWPRGNHCVDLAVLIGIETCDDVWVSTDDELYWNPEFRIERPDNLCRPDTPMIAVVQHALEAVPGPDDEIIVLLQPSSPLRSVETVKRAIQMLRDGDDLTHAIVSVSPAYPAEWTFTVEGDGVLSPDPSDVPIRRQDCRPSWKRDGVVYAFRRSTVRQYGTIYGYRAFPLYTPPEESLSIDTPADWDEAVRRLCSRNENK